MNFVSIKQIHKEFNRLNLWDKRCTNSIKRISKSLLTSPHKSFSAACGKSLRQNGSRIFSNSQLNTEMLQSTHYQETLRRCIKAKDILVVQDTTSFNYKSHKLTKGLGMINTSNSEQGIMCHSALSLSIDGIALGLLHQSYWARKKEDKRGKIDNKSIPQDQKESKKWLEALKDIVFRLSNDVRSVFVISDRESDVYEYFLVKRPINTNLLLRACRVRTIDIELDGKLYKDKLTSILSKLKFAGVKQIEIIKENKSTAINIEISYSDILINPPLYLSKKPKIAMTLIYVKETTENVKSAVEWVLLCSKTGLSASEAIQMTDYYSQRWKIERFHYTLKTGVFNVEKLQFDDSHTLSNALSLYSILAWYVMYIMYYCRQHQEVEASQIMDEIEIKILEKQTKRKVKTAYDLMMAIGILGGFLSGSKKYPYPGIKVIWAGLTKLNDLKQGWLLAKQEFSSFYNTR